MRVLAHSLKQKSRGSCSSLLTVCSRLLSTRDDTMFRNGVIMSPKELQTASASSRVQPSVKTESLRKTRCSSALSRSRNSR